MTAWSRGVLWMGWLTWLGSNIGCGDPAADRQPTALAANAIEEANASVTEGGSNRLAQQTSPYLLEHASDPVDWHPWGEEALAKARREAKPIFLSVGYSSCHWCHVMQRESFVDEQIAAYLNEHFICIKVDREERPDLDSIYMIAVQFFTRGGGGWPMSVFLTPEGKPFFGGSYFPARDGDRGNAPGFLTILTRVQEIWQNDRVALLGSGDQIQRIIEQQMYADLRSETFRIDHSISDTLLRELLARYDRQHGGFGYREGQDHIAKFPEPSNLRFLLSRIHYLGDQAAAAPLYGTLEQMARGGIRDHLGGGFHRYSVDRAWQIPHFEKMLYDQGQLASLYAEAYALSGREDLRRPLVELLEFVMREMRHPQGGFYAALDADSEGEEGKYYCWTETELRASLNEPSYDLMAAVYQFDQLPNFEGTSYLPLQARPLGALATAQGMSEANLIAQIDPLREQLLQIRQQRIAPRTDTKVLTAWNGLMITGLADAGRILEEPSYLEAASAAANYVRTYLTTDQGKLMRSHVQGEAQYAGYLDDYAFLVEGLIALHRATEDPQWLAWARELTDIQIEQFWDRDQGGFFFTTNEDSTLICRAKNSQDNALPAGNSVSAGNLIYLADAFPLAEYEELAREIFHAQGGILSTSPLNAPRLVAEMERWLARSATDQDGDFETESDSADASVN